MAFVVVVTIGEDWRPSVWLVRALAADVNVTAFAAAKRPAANNEIVTVFFVWCLEVILNFPKLLFIYVG